MLTMFSLLHPLTMSFREHKFDTFHSYGPDSATVHTFMKGLSRYRLYSLPRLRVIHSQMLILQVYR